MSVAFWSTELKKGGAPSEVQPPEGYVLNVQNAAIIGSEGRALHLYAKTQDIEGNDMDVLLTTLRGTVGSDQCQLSLVFGYDVPVQFYVKGDAKGAAMHVSGYFQPGPEDDEEPDSDEEGMDYGEFMEGMEQEMEGNGDEDSSDSDEDEEDDEEDDEEKAALYKAMAAGAASGSDDSDDDSEESEPRVQELDDEDSDSEDEQLDAAFINKMIAKNSGGAATAGGKEADKAISRLKASEPPAKKSKGDSGAQAKKGAAKGGNSNQGKKAGDKRKR